MEKYYKEWCPILMSIIEGIAHDQYPETSYWCDTGSRLNVNLAMLEQFEKDIAYQKVEEKQRIWFLPVLTIVIIAIILFAVRVGEESAKAEVKTNLCAVLYPTVEEHDYCMEEKDLDLVYTKVMLKMNNSSYRFCKEEEI